MKWKCVDNKVLSTLGLTSGVRKVYTMIEKFKQSGHNSVPVVNVTVNQRRNTCCLAVQESSTSTVAAETKEKKAEEQGNEAVAAAKPKSSSKSSYKTSATVDGRRWAKGFSISSYGSGVSTVEPFLVDEKKPTAKHVVFWVEKRLAAQGVIPVWRD
ncbi:hypothetical protein DH2020_000786 [Rehmannia glutinosa]|uniref:Uncharacterized protein n=1 Tax=Rehmannia glutinosa TaxID=99300 RepID=A0ABR0XXM0_REHGL